MAWEGFDEMVSRLGEYLPLPPDYQQQIEVSQCHEDQIRLYSRL